MSRIASLLVLTLVSVAGCDLTGILKGLSGGTMSARVDGEVFEADFARALPSAVCEATFNGDVLTLAGSDLDGPSIAIGFLLEGEGSYPLANASEPCVGGASVTLPNGTSFATDFEGASGTLSVSRVTEDRIEGTFEFTAVDGDGGASVVVTDGEFDLPRCDENPQAEGCAGL